MVKIAVLVSGGGTNLQTLIDAQQRGDFNECGKISLVLASRSDAFALERAKKAGIETVVHRRKDYISVDEYSEILLEILKEKEIDFVVLAGFMTIFTDVVTKHYKNKIINVHPSLIPSFCGKGFYGLHVHEAALKRGVKLTGATVHFVNEGCDEGPIILQKAVEVKVCDTPETLQKRVMEQAEWVLLPQVVALFCQGKIVVNENDNIVDVLD